MADIRRLHQAKATGIAAIFVHGLGGAPVDTWRHEACKPDDCWPHWLGQECNCDIWTLVLYEKQQSGLGRANTLQSLGDLLRGQERFSEAAKSYRKALALYAIEQEPMGAAYAFEELARCLHASGDATGRDAALVESLAMAVRTNTDSVARYSQSVLLEIMGGEHAANAWLERQSISRR